VSIVNAQRGALKNTLIHIHPSLTQAYAVTDLFDMFLRDIGAQDKTTTIFFSRNERGFSERSVQKFFGSRYFHNSSVQGMTSL
jgi:hypothetical protein